ncbi:MAG: putative Ig domain-containing protein [Bacteroidales bacterium]|jgi:hypothetical protein
MQYKNIKIAVLKTLFIAILFSALANPAVAQAIPPDSLYLGQTPPGNSAIQFAPGLVSLRNRRETKIVFSPDNRECLIGVGQNGAFQILHSQYEDGNWTNPVTADFIPTSRPIEPFYSPDNRQVFFTSNADIYVSARANQTWAAPVKLGSPINTTSEEYHPTVTSNGTLYFCSARNNSSLDIYRCKYENEHYSAVEKLPEVINRHDSQQTGAWDPFIAPDESYIIFSAIRAGGYGQEDQYISYNRNGNWTNPKNLGPSINTNNIEYGSYVSPDHKYYFFSRPAGWGPDAAADIYWIKADFIDSLSKTNFVPYLRTQIPNQPAMLGSSFNYQIPDSTFFDDDGNTTFTCYVTNRLPEWLNYDPETRCFSGIPTEAVNINISIKAIDTDEASASTSFSIKVENSTSALNQPFEQSFRCFPNPAKDKMYLSFRTAEYSNAKVSITNMIGKEIFSVTLHGSSPATIDVAGNPAGIYFLKLDIDGEVFYRKIILE